MCAQLDSAGFSLPSGPAADRLSEVHTLAVISPFPAAFRDIRSIARSSSAAMSSASEYLAPAHEMFTQNDLALATRRHSEQYAGAGKLAARTMRELHVPRFYSKLGPAPRVRLLTSPDIVPRVLDRYVKDAAQANFLKQANGPLPGTASALR